MPARERIFTPADFAAVFGAPPRRPWMTWLLTGAILATYVAQLAGERHGFDRVGAALAFGPQAWASHRYWTLLTYAFAHAVPGGKLPFYVGFHLAANVVPLFCVAPAVERRLGPWRLIALFFGGAVGSALVWEMGHPRPDDAIIGASGALFAILAAGGILNLRMARADLIVAQLPLRLDFRIAAIVLVAFELVQMALHEMTAVAHLAHLGGAAVGALFALTVPGGVEIPVARGTLEP
jgi:membrane associated rhomboid family serine protease